MTNITVVRIHALGGVAAERGDRYGIQISGHAGYDKSGHDIVCAGVSALTFALAEWLEENKDGKALVSEMKLEDGKDVRMAFVTKETEVVNAICMGWSLLAQAYPDYVMLTMDGF